MRELHGVINIGQRNFSALKREALLFDTIHVAQVEQHDTPLGRFDVKAAEQAELGYLISRRAIRTVSRDELFEAFDLASFELQRLRQISGTNDKTDCGATQLSASDIVVRHLAAALCTGTDVFETAPICDSGLASTNESISNSDCKAEVLIVGLKSLPVPAEDCSWEDILDFKNEHYEKRWGFRRFLRALAAKHQSEAEIRDDIEWTLNEYAKAMKLHHLRASQSFVDVFIISPLEIIENIVKFNWSKIAKGALSVRERRVDLMEAEMKAPGREVAYVFEAQKRFRKHV